MDSNEMQDLLSESEIVIRPMQSDDLAQVVAIDQMSFSLPWPERAFHYELLENPTARLWVAEIQPHQVSAQEQVPWRTQVIGMIVVWFIVDEVHIATIAVHPDYRGRGIASCLLTTALEHARQNGMKSAILEVRASNLAAQRLYSRFGFEEAGLRRRYYKDNGEDAILMTLKQL